MAEASGSCFDGPVVTAAAKVGGLVNRRRIVISLLLALALGMLLLGFWGSRDAEIPLKLRPVEIVRVFPAEGDPLRLRQEPVGFQLAEDYTGELRIDGVDIPLDQLQSPDRIPAGGGDNRPAPAGLSGLNEFSFRPGAGTDIERLAPGDHTATALYWRRGIETRDQARAYTWKFTAS